ncbi:MAG: hypothetical protein J6N20_18455 [Pseudomonas sp.]|nr:hypothetical protein [Pseudomonas sp.]
MQVIIQVILDVPEGSGKELTGDEYENIVNDLIEDQVGRGLISGVSHVTTTFEDCV